MRAIAGKARSDRGFRAHREGNTLLRKTHWIGVT